MVVVTMQKKIFLAEKRHYRKIGREEEEENTKNLVFVVSWFKILHIFEQSKFHKKLRLRLHDLGFG